MLYEKDPYAWSVALFGFYYLSSIQNNGWQNSDQNHSFHAHIPRQLTYTLEYNYLVMGNYESLFH